MGVFDSCVGWRRNQKRSCRKSSYKANPSGLMSIGGRELREFAFKVAKIRNFDQPSRVPQATGGSEISGEGASHRGEQFSFWARRVSRLVATGKSWSTKDGRVRFRIACVLGNLEVEKRDDVEAGSYLNSGHNGTGLVQI